MGLGNVAPAPVMVAVAEGALPPVPAAGARSPDEQATAASTRAEGIVVGRRDAVRSTGPPECGRDKVAAGWRTRQPASGDAGCGRASWTRSHRGPGVIATHPEPYSLAIALPLALSEGSR